MTHIEIVGEVNGTDVMAYKGEEYPDYLNQSTHTHRDVRVTYYSLATDLPGGTTIHFKEFSLSEAYSAVYKIVMLYSWFLANHYEDWELKRKYYVSIVDFDSYVGITMGVLDERI